MIPIYADNRLLYHEIQSRVHVLISSNPVPGHTSLNALNLFIQKY